MGMPIIKSPLGGRGFEYEYGQTEFTEMLSYCLMRNIDALADSGFEFSADPASAGTIEIPQPLQVFVDQTRDGDSVPIPFRQWKGEFPINIWNQQTLAIEQQTQIIERVKAGLQEKYDQLPAQTKEPGYFQQLINGVLDELAEGFFWTAVKLLFKGALFSSAIFGVAVVGVLTLKSLIEKLFNAIGDCTTMMAENQEIAAVEVEDETLRWDMFDMREKVLVRHQRDIHNMLMELMTLEKQAREHMIEPAENTTQDFKELVEALQDLNLGGEDFAELVQAVKDLQYNGQEFLYKDGSSFVLHGKTLSATS